MDKQYVDKPCLFLYSNIIIAEIMIGSTNLKVIHNSNLQIKQYRNSTNSEFGLLIMWATNEKVEIIVNSSKSKIILQKHG